MKFIVLREWLANKLLQLSWRIRPKPEPKPYFCPSSPTCTGKECTFHAPIPHKYAADIYLDFGSGVKPTTLSFQEVGANTTFLDDLHRIPS